MAENKKSFILYADLIHTVRKMSKQKAGDLFLTILSYVNDENPIISDRIIELVFEPIKQQLKRDLRRWDDFRKKQVINGKLGGRPKTQKNPKNPSLILETQKSLNVNVNVNDINKGFFLNEISMDLELTMLEVSAVKEFIQITCAKTLTEKEVKAYWKAFKIDNFKKKEWYGSHEKLISHFRHSLKKELSGKHTEEPVTNDLSPRLKKIG